MERDEKNRKLADFVGFRLDRKAKDWWHHPRCPYTPEVGDCDLSASGCRHGIPDFYQSEEASALLLEKMPQPTIRRYRSEPQEWVVFWDEDRHDCKAQLNADRKTAIAEAALALIERAEKE